MQYLFATPELTPIRDDRFVAQTLVCARLRAAVPKVVPFATRFYEVTCPKIRLIGSQ